MTKIKNYQLFSILICVKMLTIMCTSDTSCAQQMAGSALAALAGFLVSLPMLRLCKSAPNAAVIKSKPIKLLYIIFFIIWGGRSLSSLWEIAKSVYFPISSSFIGALILTAVCVYAASMGLKAVPRAAGFMTGLIAIALLVIILGALPKADLSNFSPITSFGGILRSAAQSFFSGGELVMLFILLRHTDKTRKKGVSAFFIGSFILTEIVSVIEITVLGKIMGIVKFPFFTAGSFSQPLSIQRADSLYMLLFTMLCVTVVTLQIVLSVELINDIFPRLKYKGLVPAVLMLALSGVSGILHLDLTPVTGIMIIILSVIIPVVMYIRSDKNDKNDNADASGDAPSERLYSDSRASG